jgi:hypothetical protein
MRALPPLRTEFDWHIHHFFETLLSLAGLDFTGQTPARPE